VQKQIGGEKAERESASGQLQSDLQQLLSEFLAFVCFAGSCMLLAVSHISGCHAWARQNCVRIAHFLQKAAIRTAMYLPSPMNIRLNVQLTMHDSCTTLLSLMARCVIVTNAIIHTPWSPTRWLDLPRYCTVQHVQLTVSPTNASATQNKHLASHHYTDDVTVCPMCKYICS